MKVYISGPMTGLPAHNFPAFHAAATKLRAAGFEVVNPADINPDGAKTWEECMRADIKALCDCTAIATLPGWRESRGASLEVDIGIRLGMKVRTVEIWLGLVGADAHRPAALGGQDGPAVGAPANGAAS